MECDSSSLLVSAGWGLESRVVSIAAALSAGGRGPTGSAQPPIGMRPAAGTKVDSLCRHRRQRHGKN